MLTTVLAGEDEDGIGSEFHLMEHVDGVVIRNEKSTWFAELRHREATRYQLTYNLAEIHNVDYEAAGFGEFGSPAGFSQRQVDRWESQCE